MCIRQTGLVSQNEGRFVDQQIMKRLVRIEVASICRDYPDYKTGGRYPQRNCLEVIVKPSLSEAGMTGVGLRQSGCAIPQRIRFRIDCRVEVHPLIISAGIW